MERIKRAMEKARASTAASVRFRETKSATRPAQPEVSGFSRPDIKVIRLDPISLERYRIIAGNKEDPQTAAFDMLRTHVLQEVAENGFRTLAVTSPMPGCGKTTVAINLALSVAQLTESTVVLGDLDLRRPSISEYLGLRAKQGLSDFLEGRVPLEGALVDPGIPRLLVLPNTKTYRNAAEMLTAPKMKSLVKDLQSDDNKDCLIIFDLPPMLPTDDTIAFLPQVDCVLLVVGDGATKKQDLEETLRLLKGATLLGTVLNRSDVSPSPYY